MVNGGRSGDDVSWVCVCGGGGGGGWYAETRKLCRRPLLYDLVSSVTHPSPLKVLAAYATVSVCLSVCVHSPFSLLFCFPSSRSGIH